MKRIRLLALLAFPLVALGYAQLRPVTDCTATYFDGGRSGEGGCIAGRIVINSDQRFKQTVTILLKDEKGKVVETEHASMSDGLFTFVGVGVGKYWIDINEPAFMPLLIPINFEDPRKFAGGRLRIDVTPVDTSEPTAAEMAYIASASPDKLTASGAAIAEYKAGLESISKPNGADAEQHLKKALSLDPKFYEAALALALEQERQTHRQDAIKTLEKATSLKGADARAFTALGRLDLADEQFKKSVEAFSHAAVLGSLTAEDHFNFGSAYFQTEDFAKAAAELKQAIALDPGKQPMAYQELAIADKKLKQDSDALVTVQAYLQFFPNDKNARIDADHLADVLIPPIDVQIKPAAAVADAAPLRPSVPAPNPAVPPPGDVISVSVQMVEVYVSVSDAKGDRVQNLTQDDFEIDEDGAPQTVKAFESQGAGMNIAMLVDTTGSMVRLLPQIRNEVANLLGMLGPDDSVGLFSFSNRLRTLQPFTKNKSNVMNALMSTRAEGGTALYDALTQLSRDLSKAGGKKVILLFTDGMDNQSVLTLEGAAANIRKIGVPVYTVAEGELLHSDLSMSQLKQIAAQTNGISFAAGSPRDLSNAFDKIATDLQHLYLLGYYSTNLETKNEWRKISVRLLRRPELRIRAKEGYWR